MLNSPLRSIKAKVELYNGSTLVDTYSYTGDLQEISIDRIGEESKFFGFGVNQKATIKLRDINREKNITTQNMIKIYFSDSEEYITNYPLFAVTEVARDENTNQLTIIAYDYHLKIANEIRMYYMSETNYTIQELGNLVASNLGVYGVTYPTDNEAFNIYYENGANFEGTETLKEVLDDIAEATQTIYYVDSNDILVFKALDRDGAAALTITKSDYITLDSKTNRKLVEIVSTNELGDSVSASLAATGETQYIRDNAFLELREDIADILNTALAAVGGLTINQFSCSWRGNYLLEIGDKIELITKDNGSVFSYVLNDTITYNGGLSEVTSWSYTESKAETANNPTTLGEAIKQTYAKVDKANKQIELVVSESSGNSEAIAELRLDTDNIIASVSDLEAVTQEALEGANEEIATLKKSVEAQITPEDLTIAIKSELDNGVDNVATEKGFVFNDEGLTIEAKDADGNRIGETATLITENGMQVFNSEDTAVLTANNIGVDAANLHATTYLIVGNNSRFEDYASGRTGCFWIGGNS